VAKSGGEFPPAFLTTRVGNAALPVDAKSADVRLNPHLRHQSLQHRP
jgi:hypothetical protein